MPNLPFHVQFRLDARRGKLLEDRATLAGVSPNIIARRIIEERIDQNDDAILHGLNFLAEAVTKLSQQVENLSQQDAANRQEITRLKNAMRDEFQNLATVINER